MIEYPKIESLYNRDKETFKVIPDSLRSEEFGIVNKWWVTEKIDGTNIRVMYDFAENKVTFGGRTDNAQMPGPLLKYLQETFTKERFLDVGFDADAVLFGEGYGAGIQKGGGYRKDPSFRLFDVYVGGWWLEPDDIRDVASDLDINIAPYLKTIDFLPVSVLDLDAITGEYSKTALLDGGSVFQVPEGIVARSIPLLFDRRGHRVMWKLKYKDF